MYARVAKCLHWPTLAPQSAVIHRGGGAPTMSIRTNSCHYPFIAVCTSLPQSSCFNTTPAIGALHLLSRCITVRTSARRENASADGYRLLLLLLLLELSTFDNPLQDGPVLLTPSFCLPSNISTDPSSCDCSICTSVNMKTRRSSDAL